MPRLKLHPVIEIEHEGGETVYCWGQEQGVEAVDKCLRVHPEEPISVRMIKMTEKQYDALPDYEGEC